MTDKAAKEVVEQPERRLGRSSQWTIEQVAVWIESRSLVEAARAFTRGAANSTVEELKDLLDNGEIEAIASVDAGRPEELSPSEWHHYKLEARWMMLAGTFRAGSRGTFSISARSYQSFRPGVLRDPSYPSHTLVPTELGPCEGYYRVISRIEFRRDDVLKLWSPRPGTPGNECLPITQASAKEALPGRPRLTKTEEQSRRDRVVGRIADLVNERLLRPKTRHSTKSALEQLCSSRVAEYAPGDFQRFWVAYIGTKKKPGRWRSRVHESHKRRGPVSERSK